jgi:hypothetical protein
MGYNWCFVLLRFDNSTWVHDDIQLGSSASFVEKLIHKESKEKLFGARKSQSNLPKPKDEDFICKNCGSNKKDELGICVFCGSLSVIVKEYNEKRIANQAERLEKENLANEMTQERINYGKAFGVMAGTAITAIVMVVLAYM